MDRCFFFVRQTILEQDEVTGEEVGEKIRRLSPRRQVRTLTQRHARTRTQGTRELWTSGYDESDGGDVMRCTAQSQVALLRHAGAKKKRSFYTHPKVRIHSSTDLDPPSDITSATLHLEYHSQEYGE